MVRAAVPKAFAVLGNRRATSLVASSPSMAGPTPLVHAPKSQVCSSLCGSVNAALAPWRRRALSSTSADVSPVVFRTCQASR
jgi:hypothetical protein